MEDRVLICISDMEKAGASGGVSLDAQVRAYDLLQVLVEASDGGTMPSDMVAGKFCEIYERYASELVAAFNQTELESELNGVLEPLRQAMNEARFEAAGAASLHEFAKEVYEIWQTSGVFARRRALRELRERAGFRLESHRIGNYVAKTFDLMNEAQARFARSQQTLFAADVKYKIAPDVYRKIYELLNKF